LEQVWLLQLSEALVHTFQEMSYFLKDGKESFVYIIKTTIRIKV